jgi:hypothetical protein
MKTYPKIYNRTGTQKLLCTSLDTYNGRRTAPLEACQAYQCDPCRTAHWQPVTHITVTHAFTQPHSNETYIPTRSSRPKSLRRWMVIKVTVVSSPNYICMDLKPTHQCIKTPIPRNENVTIIQPEPSNHKT